MGEQTNGVSDSVTSWATFAAKKLTSLLISILLNTQQVCFLESYSNEKIEHFYNHQFGNSYFWINNKLIIYNIYVFEWEDWMELLIRTFLLLQSNLNVPTFEWVIQVFFRCLNLWRIRLTSLISCGQPATIVLHVFQTQFYSKTNFCGILKNLVDMVAAWEDTRQCLRQCDWLGDEKHLIDWYPATDKITRNCSYFAKYKYQKYQNC